MRKKVVKFGGSSLRTGEEVSRLVRVVKRYDEPVIIVVSALYGITDILEEAVHKVKKDEGAIDAVVQTLLEVHSAVVHQCIDDSGSRQRVLGEIGKRVDELNKYLLGVHYFGEVPDFARDMVLSYGERLSSLTLCSFLKYMNMDCEEALPDEIGLITDGEYGNATVDFPSSEENVRNKLDGSKIYIVPGFFGKSADSRVTLFGRGGSDYSAAAIARCIDASSLDIWKDVPGFLSADPELVANPVAIDRLSYREAAELSYFGARILHPRTVEPLMEKKIPIRIFDINAPSDELQPHTIIDDEGVVSEDVVKSVTYSDDFGILKLIGPGVGIKPGILAKVTTRLSDARINIKSVITAQTTINILLARDDLKESLKIAKGMNLPAVDEIVPLDRISLIAVVGEGMLEKPGIAARVFSAVSSRSINVSIISAGASSVAAYFIINREDRVKAVRVIHDEFFE
jgi:aspartokinase/homoserine dehydrogenase 1